MAKNRLDFTAKLQRHSHNVTQGYTASIAPSMIVPQFFDILMPNDTIYFRTHMFVRAQDLTTAFLGEVDLHLDYFFVPLQMLYTLVGQHLTNTNDVISSFYDLNSLPDSDFPYGNLNVFFNSQATYNRLSHTVDIPGIAECRLKGAFRLLDALNFNPCGVLPDQQGQPSLINRYNPVGTYFSLLAYQAIYQKAFRNDENEVFDIGSYNIDVNYHNRQYSDSQLDKFLTLRYHQRPNDYFTNVRFSPIATSVNSMMSSLAGGVNNNVGGPTSGFEDLVKNLRNFVSAEVQEVDQQYKDQDLGSAANNMFDSAGPYIRTGIAEEGLSFINAQSIRGIFALDKYMRIYGRAGKTYDEQILAHFGVKIPRDVKHDLTKIKSYHMVLQSDPVLSTADTDNGAVGAVGGNLSAQLDTQEVKFTAPVHGVFMCVAYVLTHPRYFGTVSKLNAISAPYQFPQPEFEKLGAQPLYEYESGGFYSQDPEAINYWQDRYAEWKQKFNRCSLVYASFYGETGTNFFSPWVVSRSPYRSKTLTGDLYERPFFESAHALDDVMQVPFNSAWSDTYIANPHMVMQSDPLLTEYCCFAKKVSWMSPSGEPDL